MELYGISNILKKIEYLDLTIIEKIIHCMKFIQISKNALLYEIQKSYFQSNGYKIDTIDDSLKFQIDTNRLNEIVIIIRRKLSIDTHMIDDIDRTNDEQI